MTFGDSIRTFVRTVDARNRDVFLGTVTEVTRSIVEGSALTGAPGQPIDTGTLRASWHTDFPSATSAEISTNVEYAPYVEDNVNNVVFRNHGAHSLKLTAAGFDRIVSHVTQQVTGSNTRPDGLSRNSFGDLT